MKTIIISIIVSLIFCFRSTAQTSCASSTNINNGSCITTNFPGSVNMAGLCVGGSNPAIYLRFTAGSCSSFNITPSSNASVVGSLIYTYPGCTYVAGSAECHENVRAGYQFNADADNTSGNYLLTPGQQYVLLLWGPVGTSNFNICYNANILESNSNECSGALGLGLVPSQFYNGNDCAFNGSSTDATTTDPVASGLCAGSLENTQWIRFMPQPGVTSFQIVGSNISCTGGGCGFQFGIFSGTCGALTAEGCYGNKVCSGGQSVAGPTNVNSTDGFSISWSGTSTSGFTATITKTGGGAFSGTETFYLVMDGNADSDCTYTLQGNNIISLPVELLNFEVTEESNFNLLKWSTATENNNSHFSIERSNNAIDWRNIGIVTSIGQSYYKTNYQYDDWNFTKDSWNYYRLSQTDFDGKVEYFNIIGIYNSILEKDKVVKVVNLYGQEVDESYQGFVIEIYQSGRVRKVSR